MGGGAWPFLVGGAICLVNSDNERDSSLLNRWRVYSKKLGWVFVGIRVRIDECWFVCDASNGKMGRLLRSVVVGSLLSVATPVVKFSVAAARSFFPFFF